MSGFYSPLIVSHQAGPHKNLAKLVCKHQHTRHLNSIPGHVHDAFEKAHQFVDGAPVVLDSGCGTGESSYRLAKQFPGTRVIGIDKSRVRLQRSHQYGEVPVNLQLIQSDCVHFWRLIKQANWQIQRHYLFYPNPWPKPGHIQRRWHGHPVFPDMLALGGVLTMRTNWLIYAQEFALALEMILSQPCSVTLLQHMEAMTPFERKYLKSGHPLYEVVADLPL